MPAEHNDTLIRVADDVFEHFAFMFVDDSDAGEPDAYVRDFVQSTLKFTGPREGIISIAVTDEMRLELAANVLGMDVEDEAVIEQADDSVKELLNVLSGHVLPAVFGEEKIFDLAAPDLKQIGREKWNSMRNSPDTVELVVDDLPVLIHFSLTD